MEVIKHKTVEGSMLVSSTAVELEPAWSSTTTYSKHQRVYEGLLGVYESIVNNNLNEQPSTNPDSWTRVGPTNRQAMFDTSASTQTVGTNSLTVVIDTGSISAIALLGLQGQTLSLTAVDMTTSTVIVPTQTVSLSGAVISSWLDYFMEPFVQKTEVFFFDIPIFYNTRVTITVTGDGPVAIGHVTFGRTYKLGETQYSPTAGITDYSVKETDAYGETQFTRRNYSKKLTAKVWVDNTQLEKVQAILYDLRQTPCLWIGTREPGFAPLTVFGAYKDFSTEIPYPYHSILSIEIEGLT